MYYSLEHFEHELAVLVDDNERSRSVPRALLPAGARPGDVFREEGGAYLPAPEEAARRREEILRLQAKLRKK